MKLRVSARGRKSNGNVWGMRKNKRGWREKRERGGRSADSSYSDSSHVPAMAGRLAGLSGGLCHVAAAKTKQKEGRERW